MVHPRQLPLTLSPACLQVEATSAGLSRCSRALISGTASGIARYATIVSNTRPGHQVFSKERPPFQSPYPYPTHPKPTPHQIFHLGPGATQDEIKKRCTYSIYKLSFPLDSNSLFQSTTTDYDLVRTHHPDSSHARLSTCNSAEAHSRFRSIKAAYDFLQGRTLSPDPNAAPPPSPQHFDPHLHELARRRRAYNASRDSDSFGRSEWTKGFGAPKPEREEWNESGKKERLILLCGVLVGTFLRFLYCLKGRTFDLELSVYFYIGIGRRFISELPDVTCLHNFPYFGLFIVPFPIIVSSLPLPVSKIFF